MAEAKINNKISYQGIYPTVFKKIDASDVMINPFQVFKSWTVASGSSTSSLLPLTAIYSDINILPALGSELTYNDATNIDGSLQTIIYHSINHLFYKYKGQPNNTYGPTDLTRTSKYLYQSASVFSIPQVKIGEGIKPGSLYIFTGTGNVYLDDDYVDDYFESLINSKILSDVYGNLYDDQYNVDAIVPGVKWYEGFNEYFDINRISYNSSDVTYISGVPTSTGLSLPIGLCANFSGTGFIESPLDGIYDRDHDYALSFFINGNNTSNLNQLVMTKSSSSIAPTYPFKIELSGSNQLIFSVAGTNSFIVQVTSSLAVNSWTHVVCQKKSNTLEMYLNGILHSGITDNMLINTLSPFTASARIDNNSNLYIGGFNNQNLNLNAKLDEIRIFNRSLIDTEINSLGDRVEGGTLLQTNIIGNVFSKHGIIVVSSADYRYNDILDNYVSLGYRSTVTINELSVVAKLDAGDFNMSTNLTLTKDDDITYQPFVSGSDFAPYITTIGLYDDAGQLLAIGKMAQVIRKRDDVDMNFLIRIDLDKNIAFKGE